MEFKKKVYVEDIESEYSDIVDNLIIIEDVRDDKRCVKLRLTCGRDGSFYMTPKRCKEVGKYLILMSKSKHGNK